VADIEPRRVLGEYIQRVNARDWRGALERLAHDYTEEWPQTGERVRGRENLRRIFEQYPGQITAGWFDTEQAEIVGTEDRYVLTPAMTMLRVDGGGEMYTATYTATYPDGSRWYVVMIARIVDGKLRRAHTYWAPVLPAPEWRREWVERIPTTAPGG